MTVETRVDPGGWDAVVTDVDGPQLVVAGPGTGKTELLVRRAAHLIDAVVDRGDEVLLLTFSRRAAADFRRRVSASVPRSVDRVAASTFHSFAHRLLEAQLGGEVPALLTGPEHVALVSSLLREEEPSGWPATFRGLLGSRTLAGDVADLLLRCAERLIGPDELAELAAERADWRALPRLLQTYLRRLDEVGRMDYGTLLTRAVELAGEPRVADALAEQHRFVLVDEYQDTSPAQAALLDRMTASHRNITVAGDPYQSVYSFRGAELGNIAQFPDRFRSQDGGPARRIVLTTSFRVPAGILEAALRVTSGGRLPGGAGPVEPADHSGQVEARVFDQASAEAEWIAREAEHLHLVDRLPYSQMAVLVRSKRRFLPELSRALGRRGIPHDSPDVRLVDHPAIRLVFDLAEAAALHARDPADPALDAAVRRLLLGPLFALPVGQERDLLRSRRKASLGWPEALRTLGPGGSAVARLLEEGDWATRPSALEGFWAVWDSLPQLEEAVHDPERRGDRAAWAAFAQALERQEERDPAVSLLDYREMTAEEDFEATPLLSFSPSPGDRLTLTTLHQAKGLEFEVVFIADASEGVFPDLRRGVSLLQAHALTRGLDTAGLLTRFRLQEEMRLAYTASTRARRRLVWTATAAGLDESERRPSRFLLAAVGADSADELSRPEAERPPVTIREVEAHLRRLLVTPDAPAAHRLASAAVLASGLGDWDPLGFAGVRLPGPDTGVIEGGLRLSPSQADAYRACPRNYVFERRLGVGDVTSPSASFGSLVHETLERSERAAREQGRPRADLEEMLEVLDRVWEEEADFGSEAFDLRWKLKAVEALTWMSEHWPQDALGPVALEHPLELDLDGRRWTGRADRVELLPGERLRVVDYKTSTRPMTIDQAKESLQLGFYLLAALTDPVLRAHGEPCEAELWYPRARSRSWRRGFDPRNLPEVEERLVNLGGGIASEEWGPTVGEACRYCRVKLVCPLWPEGREAYAS